MTQGKIIISSTHFVLHLGRKNAEKSPCRNPHFNLRKGLILRELDWNFKGPVR